MTTCVQDILFCNIFSLSPSLYYLHLPSTKKKLLHLLLGSHDMHTNDTTYVIWARGLIAVVAHEDERNPNQKSQSDTRLVRL
jgi:hypothetical protein